MALHLLLGRIYDDKDVQERIVHRSKLDWVIVRPVILTSGPKTESLSRVRRSTRLSAQMRVGRSCFIDSRSNVYLEAAIAAAAGSAESLAISLFTKLRNSELNGASRCESLFMMYSIFGPSSFCDPIPPKVIHGFGL